MALAVASGRANAGERLALIDYSAPAGCPAASAFLAEVEARTSRADAAAPAPVAVRVEAAGAGFRGSLSVGKATREVTGGSCEEVVGALALVVALALEGDARLAAAPPKPSPPARPGVPPPAPERRASGEPPEPLAAEAEAERPRAPAPSRSGPIYAAGLGAEVTSGIAPDPMYSPSAFLELRLNRRALIDPTLRLHATRAASGTFEVPGGTARLVWYAGALDACPVRWSWEGLSVSPCVRMSAGALSGSGDAVAHPRDAQRLWLDAGALVRLEIAVGGPLFLDVEGGVTVAITRPRFHFDVPDTTIRQPAAALALGGAHAGVHFP